MTPPEPKPAPQPVTEDAPSNDFFWIGIGSSAGGLEALQKLVRNLPQKNNATYVVVQHLSPRHKSLLATLIKRETTLDVVEIDSGVAPLPNTVYVTPPNNDVVVKDGTLCLQAPNPELAASKPSVDRFFLSLASEKKDRSVGLILSGTGSDGSYGVQAIRAAGGITLAQTRESAKYDGMPSAAIESGCIDLILNPSEIGLHLDRILNDPKMFEENQRSPDQKHSFEGLIQLLRDQTGVDFSEYKFATMQRRVDRRMAALGLENQIEYVSYARRHSREVESLYRDMLISVTSFFRDNTEFETLSRYVKDLVDERENRKVRVWIAGCATGEEAYSIAILLADALGGPEFLDKTHLQIFATDIDTDALKVARRGIYSVAALDAVPDHIVSRYFRRDEDGFSVLPALKEVILFSRHNVCQDPPFLNIDLITCRNMLIYFNSSLQSKVLSRMHYALAPNGLLFLGNSESIAGTEDLFRSISNQAKIFRKRIYSNVQPPGSSPRVPRTARHNTMGIAKRELDKSKALQAQAKFDALSRSVAPKSILVSGDMRILSVYGDISQYLELAETQSPQLTLSLLRQPLAQEARSLLTLALKSHALRRGTVWKNESDSNRRYQLTAFPIDTEDEDDDIIGLIAFNEWLDIEGSDTTEIDLPKDAARRIEELQTEVASAKEALQQSVEELEASNEELQSLNEELQSTNEELQSTNEELETSNEELQSTNEELVTVNHEQMAISRELSTMTEELGSILSNIAVPIIVVNIAMQVIRASEVAKEILNISTLNEEPHISHFKMPEGFPNLSDAFHQVLTAGKSHELEVDIPGHIYTIRLTPFFDSRGRLTGATAVFVGTQTRTEQQDLLEIQKAD